MTQFERQISAKVTADTKDQLVDLTAKDGVNEADVIRLALEHGLAVVAGQMNVEDRRRAYALARAGIE